LEEVSLQNSEGLELVWSYGESHFNGQLPGFADGPDNHHPKGRLDTSGRMGKGRCGVPMSDDTEVGLIGDFPSALRDVKTALELQPNHPEAENFSLAVVKTTYAVAPGADPA
jgi:hypothetical protein